MSKKPERRDIILDAALAIADKDGLESLTLRRIESETGLSAPLVYRHFKDKAEIVVALAERMLLRASPIDSEPDDVHEWLMRTFEALYHNGRDHSAWLTLLATVDPMQVNALGVTEIVLKVLRSAGLDERGAGHAFQLLMAYTIGSAVMARGTMMTQEVLIEALSRLPLLAQSGAFLDPRSDIVFRTGLSAILDSVGIRKA